MREIWIQHRFYDMGKAKSFTIELDGGMQGFTFNKCIVIAKIGY